MTPISDYADQWTKEVKTKIIEDASQQPDRVDIDSSTGKVILYKGNRRLKYFKLNVDNMYKHTPTDTVASIFYSADQNFELVREHCPSVSRSFEGIKWEGQPVGLAEFRYCNGKLMEKGYRFYTDIGVWKKYDTSGNLVSTIDYHGLKRLEMLKEIKYYR